jgi:hypothetical protein
MSITARQKYECIHTSTIVYSVIPTICDHCRKPRGLLHLDSGGLAVANPELLCFPAQRMIPSCVYKSCRLLRRKIMGMSLDELNAQLLELFYTIAKWYP